MVSNLQSYTHYSIQFWLLVYPQLSKKKKKKQKVPRKNNNRRRLRRWHSDTGKYIQSGRNTTE